MPPDITLLSIVAAIGVCALAATVQGTVGFGFAMLAVPGCALIDPRFAPVPQALLAFLLTAPMAWREREFIEPRGILWIMVGRVLGAVLGVMLLGLATQRTLDLTIAGFVLAAVVVLWTGLKVRRTPVTESGAGVVSGFGSLVSSIGGPPIALLYQGEHGGTLRANLAAIFALGLLLTYAGRLFGGKIGLLDMYIALCLAPGMIIALTVSKRLAPKIEGLFLRRAVLWVAATAAIVLIARAW